MRELTLLVVDDDGLVHESVKIMLPKGWRMLSARSPNLLPPKGFHCALVDVHLTGQLDRTEGVGVIRTLLKSHPQLEVIAMSGHLDRPIMEACIKAGASRFLPKPLNAEELSLLLQKVENLFQLRSAGSESSKVQWIGTGPSSQAVLKQIALLQNEPGPILIEGETGTGKEVTAKLLHNHKDSKGPFVSVNVSALPESLFESELFGHIKGAFTGADKDRMGLVEAAHGGDLFLDEIEALPLNLQSKLLRFLESGEARKVGAHENYIVETRVIAASNKNLDEMVKKGEFREDLLWRLKGKKIQLPPLRERTEDLPELIQFFLKRNSQRQMDLEADAIEVLKAHTWPGNTRELKRWAESIALYAPLPFIRKADVTMGLAAKIATEGSLPTLDLTRGMEFLLNEYESKVIQTALKQYNDIDDAAKALQISRSSLYKKIKDFGIDWKPTS